MTRVLLLSCSLATFATLAACDVGEIPSVVVLEASIRLRDVRNRVAASGEEPWWLPTPALFTPPPPMLP